MNLPCNICSTSTITQTICCEAGGQGCLTCFTSALNINTQCPICDRALKGRYAIAYNMLKNKLSILSPPQQMPQTQISPFSQGVGYSGFCNPYFYGSSPPNLNQSNYFNDLGSGFTQQRSRSRSPNRS
jgi:hypothetical protein